MIKANCEWPQLALVCVYRWPFGGKKKEVALRAGLLPVVIFAVWLWDLGTVGTVRNQYMRVAEHAGLVFLRGAVACSFQVSRQRACAACAPPLPPRAPAKGSGMSALCDPPGAPGPPGPAPATHGPAPLR